MLKMKSETGVFLVQTAVFTTSLCAIINKSSEFG